MLHNTTNQAVKIAEDAMKHKTVESEVTSPVVQTLFHIKIIIDFILWINIVKHCKAQLSSILFTQFTLEQWIQQVDGSKNVFLSTTTLLVNRPMNLAVNL